MQRRRRRRRPRRRRRRRRKHPRGLRVVEALQRWLFHHIRK
jgi:hypothetical protein